MITVKVISVHEERIFPIDRILIKCNEALLCLAADAATRRPLVPIITHEGHSISYY
jgi:hypothetical protein